MTDGCSEIRPFVMQQKGLCIINYSMVGSIIHFIASGMNSVI